MGWGSRGLQTLSDLPGVAQLDGGSASTKIFPPPPDPDPGLFHQSHSPCSEQAVSPRKRDPVYYSLKDAYKSLNQTLPFAIFVCPNIQKEEVFKTFGSVKHKEIQMIDWILK